MTGTGGRVGVCGWCGTTFEAPSRGRIPIYCKTSHRIRAYEQRKMAAALADAARQGPGGPPTTADHPDEPAGKQVRVTINPAPDAIAELRAVTARAAGVAPTSPAALRDSLAEVAGAVRGVLAGVGLPEIDPEDAAWWSLVVPVAGALEQAETTLSASPRSARNLHAALGGLLSAAGELADPEAAATRRTSFAQPLPVAVPGPSGFAAGTFETDRVGRYKTISWVPDADIASTRALPELAGRPESFRYRWEDAKVWERLAHDMIVVACGWHAHPDRLPPALAARAAFRLGDQLRRDLGPSEWAIHTHAIVTWLARTGLVTIVAPLPDPTHSPTRPTDDLDSQQ